MTTPRQIELHESINRPHLLLGADRRMVIMTATLALALVLALRSWWGCLLSLGIWLGMLAILIRMAARDPLLRLVYLRHMRYRPYYAARSGLLARPVRRPSQWDRKAQ